MEPVVSWSSFLTASFRSQRSASLPVVEPDYGSELDWQLPSLDRLLHEDSFVLSRSEPTIVKEDKWLEGLAFIQANEQYAETSCLPDGINSLEPVSLLAEAREVDPISAWPVSCKRERSSRSKRAKYTFVPELFPVQITRPQWRHQQAERAKALGVGETAADYRRYQQEALAKALGVGETAADYDQHIKAELAKKLGVGETAADYQRHQRAELAKALGVGKTAADYHRYQLAERAKALGVGETAADYQRHQRAERAKALGVGKTAADYARHQNAKRAKALGVGETSADYLRYLKRKRAAAKQNEKQD